MGLGRFKSILTLLLVWGCSFSASAERIDNPSLAFQWNQDTGDFTRFKNLLNSNSFTTVEETLDAWKKERPLYFSQYVSAYRSRSLQHATPFAPRILMFNENADLVLTFNGHLSEKGFQTIEVMRFNHDKDAFEFYELDFSSGEKVQFAEQPNPKKCMVCHQGPDRSLSRADLRPNWEPYSRWPGFYGSLEDNTSVFKENFLNSSLYNKDTDQMLAYEIVNEEAWYKELVINIIPVPGTRYSLIVPTMSEYTGRTTLNAEFTNRLHTLNTRRVARLMKESPAYEFVKWTVWAHANCEQKMMMPADVYYWLKENVSRQEYQSLEEIAKIGSCEVSDDLCRRLNMPKAKYAVVGGTRMVNMMFEAFGVNTDDWSMDFKTGARYASLERFGATNDSRPAWKAAINRAFAQDPDFKDMTCEKAEQKSLEQMSSVEKIKEFRNRVTMENPPAQRKPLIQRCISCHVEVASAGGIPSLPFDDEAELTKALQRQGYKRGRLIDEIIFRIGPHAVQGEQMPPNINTTEAERDGLVKYIQSLGGR